jgi:hypothetical protein
LKINSLLIDGLMFDDQLAVIGPRLKTAAEKICDRGYPLVAKDESNAQLILRIER